MGFTNMYLRIHIMMIWVHLNIINKRLYINVIVFINNSDHILGIYTECLLETNWNFNYHHPVLNLNSCCCSPSRYLIQRRNFRHYALVDTEVFYINIYLFFNVKTLFYWK